MAHLGNGASLCALRSGRSVETTIGLSALDGLMMGTRPGALDPGALLYLMAQQPTLVLDAHHFLRDTLFEAAAPKPEAYWHRPIVVRDMRTRLGEVIGRMKVTPEHPGDDVVDNDLILVWGPRERRIITGADLLGRLLRGIATRDGTSGEGRAPPQAPT